MSFIASDLLKLSDGIYVTQDCPSTCKFFFNILMMRFFHFPLIRAETFLGLNKVLEMKIALILAGGKGTRLSQLQ